MKKKSFDFIFIVLVYRNTKDLIDFFKNFKVRNTKVIVVNSFYDDNTDSCFSKIAIENDADYITKENKGYGSGNNRGIEYALNHYDFKYLIISNADIYIESLELSRIDPNVVTAPKILTLKGKNQNPSTPFKPSKLRETILYKLYKGNHNRLIWLLYAYNRFTKILFYSFSKFKKEIFSPHGAFIIIPYVILKNCNPLFNEEMFLFNEEEHLGKLLKTKGYKVKYNPKIIIRHKEDGSVSFMNQSLFNMQRDSYLIFHDFWTKNKNTKQ